MAKKHNGKRRGEKPRLITPSPAAALGSLSSVALSSGRAGHPYHVRQTPVNAPKIEKGTFLLW